MMDVVAILEATDSSQMVLDWLATQVYYPRRNAETRGHDGALLYGFHDLLAGSFSSP